MKILFRTIIILGIPHWLVSVVEFALYRKTSGSLILASICFAIGFGGLFVYNEISGRK